MTFPQFARAADITVLHAISTSTDGTLIYGRMIEDPDEAGSFYGLTAFGNATIWKITSSGTFTVLYNFPTSGTGLKYSYGGLLLGSDGMLYGTTYYGGASNKGGMFKFDPSTKTFTSLHEFAGTADGAYPYATLIEDDDGYLWGTAQGGGANGYGSIYKMAKDGTNFTLVHSFTSTDGKSPYSGLTYASDGALYGTTYTGGANGRGVIYKITTDGTYSVLYSFPSSTTYLGPPLYSTLLEGSDGRLYGNSRTGGAYGYGGLFGIDKDGTDYADLYLFTNGTDGAYPQSGLTEDAEGGLLGTTSNGGDNGYGEIYRVTKSGDITGVYPMTYYNNSYAALTLGSDGLWYGSTNAGSSSLGQGSGYLYSLDYDAAAPLPTIDISLSASKIRIGSSVTLAWNTVNATTCVASNAWAGNKDLDGGETETPTSVGTFTYVLTCSGRGGNNSASADLTVTSDPALQVSLSASQARVLVGQQLHLSWTTVSAISCTASGDWSGTMPVNGAADVRIKPGPDIIRSYTLTCSDDYGMTQSSTVTVGVAH